jgi:hypothetical protein
MRSAIDEQQEIQNQICNTMVISLFVKASGREVASTFVKFYGLQMLESLDKGFEEYKKQTGFNPHPDQVQEAKENVLSSCEGLLKMIEAVK